MMGRRNSPKPQLQHSQTRSSEPQDRHNSGDAPISNPHLFAPTTLLQLQRTIGNQALLRLHGQSSTVQRDESPNTLPVGNVYERKFEKKGDRWSFALSISFSKKDVSPAKGKSGDVSGQLGEVKMGRSTAWTKDGAKTANSISAALAKASFDIAEIMPGVKVKFDVKGLEAKLEKGDVDIDVFKVAVAVEGEMTQAIKGTALGDLILSTSLGELIMNGTAIKIKGQVEIKIDPADVARLVRMAKLSKEVTKNAEAAAKALKKQEALVKQNKALQKQLERKMNPAKRRNLKLKLDNNKKKIKELSKALEKNAKSTKALKEGFDAAAKGLKSKAGRVVGQMVKKVAGKLLLKAIPVVGWLLTAVDVGSLLYAVFNGAQLGFGGGDGGDAESGGAEGEGGADGGTADGGTADGGDSDGGTSEGGTSDIPGGVPGDIDATGGDGGVDIENLPDIDINEDTSFEPSSDLTPDQGQKGNKQPALHPAADSVAKAIKNNKGIKLSPDDIAELNNIIPNTLTEDQLKALLESLKDVKGEAAKDPFELLGALQERIARIQNPPQNITVTDETGQVEQVADPDLTPDVKDANQAPADQNAQPDPKDNKAGKPPAQNTTTKKKEPKPKEPKVDIQKIIEGISNARSAMEPQGLTMYMVLPKEYKQGTTFDGWMYFKVNEHYVGAYTQVTIVKYKEGSNIATIKISPANVYTEGGHVIPNGIKGGTLTDIQIF